MTTLTHKVTISSLRSLDKLLSTLNSIPLINCYVLNDNIVSIDINIDLNFDPTFQDVLSLGTLIGSIETASLI